MRTWRLVVFGCEIVRTEAHEDADKTIIEAVREMIEDVDEIDEVTEYYGPLSDSEREIEPEDPEVIIFHGGENDED